VRSYKCSRVEDNKSILGCDEDGILLRHVEYSTNIEGNVELCGDSAITSHSEEGDLDERIYFKKKLTSTLKEIKELS